MPRRSSAYLSTANDTTVAWYALGSGPPLILLHGLADSHRTWQSVTPLLANRFRVFMLDLPGHGFSARPDAPYTLPWYAETVVAWMDAIGLERAHICGHSYGGGIAQWMLLENRDRIDRLALVAAGGLGREVGAILRLAALPLAGSLIESSFFGPIASLAMQWTHRSLGDREQIKRLASCNTAPNSGLAFRRTVEGCVGLRGQHTQTWHHLHKVASLPPMALFWGARDSIIPVRHAHEAVRRLENVTLTVYPDRGHCLHLEEPGRFSADLTQFLDEPMREPAHYASAA
jgi:pimeloyl-ACP methyl ester carboxylesterase